MSRIVKIIDSVLAVIAGTLFLFLFLITTLNIVLRNVGGIAWLWIPGMSKLLFIWIVFLGSAVLYQRNDHLLIDYFISKIPPQRRRKLEFVNNMIFLVFLIVLIIYGFMIAKVRMGIPFETWNFPTGYAYAAAPVSAIIMSFFCIHKLRVLLKGERGE